MRRELRWVPFCTLLITLAVASVPLWAQESVEIRRGTVVYVSGNDLVVKMEDGTVKHVTVPSDFKFNVDGKELTVSELKPGTKLTQTITTTKKEENVTSVRQVNAKVWQVNAPYLIVTLPDGTNKRVKVPEGTKFTVNGEQKTVFDLRPGMQLSGTIATTTPTVTMSRQMQVGGQAPPPPAPAPKIEPPQLVGVLLIEEREAPPPPQTTARAAAPPPAPEPAPAAPTPAMPNTAGSLPLIGLLGAASLSLGVALNMIRRRLR